MLDSAPKNGSTRQRGQVTMEDVARLAGVAPMTVSYTFSGKRKISDETRQRVLATAKELGFEPNPAAQRLAAGAAHDLIGIFARYLDYGVQSQKLQIIQGRLIAAGHQVPIYTGGYNQQPTEAITAMFSALRRQRPRALVCNLLEMPSETLRELERYIEGGGIAVTYDVAHDLPCDRVVFDRENSTGEATRHLLELGHRKIGFFHHHIIRQDDMRFIGFAKTLREAGLEPHGDWLFSGKEGLHPEIAGVAMAAHFLAMPTHNRPSALLVINDYSALTLIAELARAGVSVPRDVSIIGHDDWTVAAHSLPPLTTASHPIQDIGESVVELLQSRLDGFAGAPREVVLRGQLKIRESCALCSRAIGP